MTIDKERLRVLAKAATPGPWKAISRAQYWGEEEGDVMHGDFQDVDAAEFVKPIGDVPTTRGQMWLRDAEFIAASRDAIPALLSENAALAAENERQAALVERLKQEAQIHAQEARTANATIAEIYQCVTGATGEPGNWNGAAPVRELVERLRKEHMTAINQREELRHMIDRRPAMNAGLVEAYIKWSGDLYALDWLNALDDLDWADKGGAPS